MQRDAVTVHAGPVFELRHLDGDMRPGMRQVVRELRRLPTEPWEDLSRGKTRPWAVLLRRLMEAALAGASRQQAEGFVHTLQAVMDRIWAVFGAVPPVRLKLLPAAARTPELPPRVAVRVPA